MEILMMKLSEILEIGIEGAKEVYPILKSQLLAYNVGGLLLLMISTCVALVIVGVLVGLGIVVSNVSYGTDDEDYLMGVKILKITLYVMGVTTLLVLSRVIILYKFAPDIMMIKEFL